MTDDVTTYLVTHSSSQRPLPLDCASPGFSGDCLPLIEIKLFLDNSADVFTHIEP